MSTTRPAAASVSIRACEVGHVAAITKIYAHHVLHGLASFETEPPSENDMRQRRFGIVSRGFPYLVAECAGEVVGYAYVSPYRLRPLTAIPLKTRSTYTHHGLVEGCRSVSIRASAFARLAFSVLSGSNSAAGSTAS